MMNSNDFSDQNYNWDAEKSRRMWHVRLARARVLFDTCVNAVMALLALAVLVWLCYKVSRRPVEERAAYNEGRYGVSREVAVAMAERGEGKTAREVLTTDYTDSTDCEVR